MSTVKFSDALLTKANTKLAFALAASVLLSACGAGGGSDTTAVESSNVENQTPEVVEQTPEQVAPVQIFAHPQSVTVEAGQNAIFSVAASGGGSLSYQWLRNGLTIQGANANSLVFANALESDSAVYSVVVSNSAGSQSSLSALLTVNAKPVVIVPGPVVEEPVIEAPVVEEPVVEEPVIETPVVEIPVVEEPVVEEPVVEEPVVEEPVVEEPVVEEPVVEEPVVEEPVVEEPVVEEPVVEEPVVEEPVVEEPVVEEPVVEEPVIAPVAILTQPESIIVDESASASFSVQVSGDGEISYQWLKNGAVIDGATAATLSISAATLDDAAEYSVIVKNSEGTVFSEVVALTVNAVQLVKSIALSWDIPQEREDGTALEIYEIEGYVIAYGTDANNLDQQITVQGASVQEAVLENLSGGTYYFAIATVDSDGAQGTYSATIEQSI